MGKYMDVPHHHHHHQPSLGVRTRAKTKNLALQRLQNPMSKSKPTPCSSNSSSSSSMPSSCYLQLRSRRLEKCFASKTRSPNSRTNLSPVSSFKEVEESLGENAVEIEGKSNRGPEQYKASNESVPNIGSQSKKGCTVATKKHHSGMGLKEHCSSSNYSLQNERNSRETTPCSLIRRDVEISETPRSTNRPVCTTASNTSVQTAMRRNFPTSPEMEEFFSVPEERQQKAFREKYNFDPANDCPLPGRYEWVKLQN